MTTGLTAAGFATVTTGCGSRAGVVLGGAGISLAKTGVSVAVGIGGADGVARFATLTGACGALLDPAGLLATVGGLDAVFSAAAERLEFVLLAAAGGGAIDRSLTTCCTPLTRRARSRALACCCWFATRPDI